jgi:uncharacterized HAD superfamily protein
MPADELGGNWGPYYEGQVLDDPIHRVLNFVRTMALSHEIWLITARSEMYRHETEYWLAQHKVPYSKLMMRPVGDKRGSPELKVWMVEDALKRIVMLIDDREDVLDAFRRLGVPVLPTGMIS